LTRPTALRGVVVEMPEGEVMGLTPRGDTNRIIPLFETTETSYI